MRQVKPHFCSEVGARFSVASGTRAIGVCGLGRRGLLGGDRPVGYGGSLTIRPASTAKPAWWG
jgi:hypothetical protein